MIFTTSPLIDFLGILVSLVVCYLTYRKWRSEYWRRKNFPYLEISSLNTFNRKEQIGVKLQQLYKEIKARGWKHCGMYGPTGPFYFLTDLDYVKNILTKDFEYFVDRGFYYNEKEDPLRAHLFTIGGSKWRNMRTKLTPTFTSGKMRMMFPTILECVTSLKEMMENEIDKNEPIDIKEVLACFTTDIIGSCAFGLDFNSIKDKNSPFRIYGKKAFKFDTIATLKRFIANGYPELARLIRLRITPSDVTDFFMKVVKDTVEYREKNNFYRDDFMQLLLQLKNNNDNKNNLTIEQLAAQCFVFFLAGFETSSTTMTFALYELAKHPDIQEKLRNEIVHVLNKHEGKITYEAIQEMKYMSQVLDETLRKYPPLAFLIRQCVKDYKIPDEDLVIEKGIRVFIPILGIHNDEEFYPEPKKFDPDRFTEENKKLRPHYAHIPFGEGPRNCIGLRFGLVQSKVGLTSLLRYYKFKTDKKTKEPLKMLPNSPILTAEGDIWLDVERI